MQTQSQVTSSAEGLGGKQGCRPSEADRTRLSSKADVRGVFPLSTAREHSTCVFERRSHDRRQSRLDGVTLQISGASS